MPLFIKKKQQKEEKSIFDELEEKKKTVLHEPLRKPAPSLNIMVLLVGVILLSMGIIGINYFRANLSGNELPLITLPIKNPTEETIVAEPTKTLIKKIENKEIINTVFSWIKNQKNSDNSYKFGLICSSFNQCQIPAKDDRVALMALRAYFKHYQAYKDPGDIVQIDSILNNYTYWGDYKVPFYFQNEFWNCKWTAEISKADFLTEGQKKMAKNICLGPNNSYYPPLDESNGNPKIDLAENFVRFSCFASDYSSRFLLDQDRSSIELAKGYFNQAVSFWSQQPAEKYLFGKCLLGIAALDIFNITKDNQYLDFAKQFMEKEKIRDVCFYDGKSKLYSSYCADSAFEKSTCALFAQQLFGTTKEEKYNTIANDLVNGLVLLNFDGEGYPRAVNNFKAFYSKSGENTLFYETRDNVLALEALLNQ